MLGRWVLGGWGRLTFDFLRGGGRRPKYVLLSNNGLITSSSAGLFFPRGGLGPKNTLGEVGAVGAGGGPACAGFNELWACWWRFTVYHKFVDNLNLSKTRLDCQLSYLSLN